MGGYGSGWQGSKKATVEGSLVLIASALVRKKALVPGAQTAGSWGWTYEGEDGPHATVLYEADLRDTDNAWLRLHYRANGEAVDYKVRLVDHEAELWRAQVVVHLPDRAPRQQCTATGSEALPPIRQQVFSEVAKPTH